MTQAEPGELFILRNAGNLVPSYGTTIGSTIATIEYAVGVLDVKNIIIETGDVWTYDFDQGAFRSLLQTGAKARRKRT